MDALILCGGFATRLEPLTLFVPKPLLPIGGKPILDHIIDSVVDLGADRIVLSTNMKFRDQFDYWVENKRASGFGKRIEIVAEPSMHNGEKFGAIKGINYTIESAKLNKDLLIVAGDNFFTFGLKKIADSFKNNRNVTIAVYDVRSKYEAQRFGVVELKGNLVRGFEEKPKNPKSSHISTGIYMFPKEMLGRFGEYVKDGNNPDAPGYFLQWLIKREKICGVIYSEDWYDIGTVDSYKEVFDRHLANATRSPR
ncbi:MAG: nucleotidyltransferase family protein [Candidatus Micrarchaeaceae archaeon]